MTFSNSFIFVFTKYPENIIFLVRIYLSLQFDKPCFHYKVLKGPILLVGWLFWGPTSLSDSISLYIEPSPERDRKRREMIDEKQIYPTIPICTSCKHNMSLPYYSFVQFSRTITPLPHPSNRSTEKEITSQTDYY